MIQYATTENVAGLELHWDNSWKEIILTKFEKDSKENVKC